MIRKTAACFAAAIAFTIASIGQVPNRPHTISSEIILETPTGKIYGTLLVPDESSPRLIALIIAGSGPTDRDGNSVGLGENPQTLKLLAEGLANKGIASLRYDKRSVAKSAAARLPTNSFDTQVDDAASWVDLLARDKRFDSIALIGHSEGGTIGTLATQRGHVSALVSLSAAGKVFDQVLIEQFEAAVHAKKLPAAVLEAAKPIFQELKAGRTVTTRPAAIPGELWTGLFQPRAQEYLISLFKYDPIGEMEKLVAKGVRVLVVQGTADEMGGGKDPEDLARASGTKPLLITGMMHELRLKGKDQLAPSLMEAIAGFLLEKASATDPR